MLRPQHIEQKQPYVDDSCKLLLHMNGVSGNQQFIDSSNNSKVVTPYGNACLSNSHYRFGGTSAYFDGTGDYLRIVSSSIPTGTSNFTVSFWWYESSGTPNYPTPFSFSTGGTYATSKIFIEGRTGLGSFLLHTPSVNSTFTFTRTQTTWNHWCLTRENGLYTLYYNGISVGTVSDTTSNTSTYLQIGGDGSFYTTGYIDEFIYWNGIAFPIGMLYPQLRPYGYPIGGT